MVVIGALAVVAVGAGAVVAVGAVAVVVVAAVGTLVVVVMGAVAVVVGAVMGLVEVPAPLVQPPPFLYPPLSQSQQRLDCCGCCRISCAPILVRSLHPGSVPAHWCILRSVLADQPLVQVPPPQVPSLQVPSLQVPSLQVPPMSLLLPPDPRRRLQLRGLLNPCPSPFSCPRRLMWMPWPWPRGPSTTAWTIAWVPPPPLAAWARAHLVRVWVVGVAWLALDGEVANAPGAAPTPPTTTTTTCEAWRVRGRRAPVVAPAQLT